MLSNTDPRKNTLTVALLCAIAAHASLAFIKIGLNLNSNDPEPQPITIQIQNLTKPANETEDRATEREAPETQEQLEPEKPQEPVTEEIVVSNEVTNEITIEVTTDEQVPLIMNTNSSEFKQWIKQETEQHIENNPDTLQEFAQSFVIPTPEPHAKIEKEVSPLQTGLYTTSFNGKVTCHLQTVLPFHNDFSTTINISKDCTPRKKFTLNIK